MHVSVQEFLACDRHILMCSRSSGCCIVISSCQEVGQPQPPVDQDMIQSPRDLWQVPQQLMLEGSTRFFSRWGAFSSWASNTLLLLNNLCSLGIQIFFYLVPHHKGIVGNYIKNVCVFVLLFVVLQVCTFVHAWVIGWVMWIHVFLHDECDFNCWVINDLMLTDFKLKKKR